MQRGEIWWANLSESAGHRPVVIVTRNHAVQVRGAITVAEITTRVRQLPVEVSLGPDDGLPKTCVINCDVLATIPKTQLHDRIALLSPTKIQQLDDALLYAFGLD